MTTDLSLISKSEYWDSFYSQTSRELNAPRYPSQFAAFAASELATAANCRLILEFGCGNGRDSEFFASCGFNVIATDASESAINTCLLTSVGERVQYFQVDVNEARNCVVDALKCLDEHSVIAIYARFFLHAITDDEQAKFIRMLGVELPMGALVFFEYRTEGDASDQKEFGPHYRRFQPHKRVLQALDTNGFHIEYEIEGKGMAKYKTEDAVVGRCIARKR